MKGRLRERRHRQNSRCASCETVFKAITATARQSLMLMDIPLDVFVNFILFLDGIDVDHFRKTCKSVNSVVKNASFTQWRQTGWHTEAIQIIPLSPTIQRHVECDDGKSRCQNVVESKPFEDARGHSWMLYVFPDGNEAHNFVSVYLAPTKKWQDIHATFRIELVQTRGSTLVKTESNAIDFSRVVDWGWRFFCEKDSIHDQCIELKVMVKCIPR